MFQWWCYPYIASTGKRREWISQNWLPSIPTLMPPSGVIYHLRSLSIHCEAHSLWSQRCLHLIFFFLCYIVCRILILWPGIEMVPPALEAQRHNHWVSRTSGHPGKSWCLHLRNSVVSSNPALALASLGGPSWSTPATPSKLRPHPINTTQVTLSFDMYLFFAYLSGWQGHS